MDLTGFDASSVPESSFSALPAGDYIVIATNSERKETKLRTGHYLQFTLEVMEGTYKGRKLWSRINLWNKNSEAVAIAQRELADFCLAVGIPKPTDSRELLNIPFQVTIKVTSGKNGEQNEIAKYSAFTGSAPAAASPAVPSFPSQGGVAQPAASGLATPPWLLKR